MTHAHSGASRSCSPILNAGRRTSATDPARRNRRRPTSRASRPPRREPARRRVQEGLSPEAWQMRSQAPRAQSPDANVTAELGAMARPFMKLRHLDRPRAFSPSPLSPCRHTRPRRSNHSKRMRSKPAPCRFPKGLGKSSRPATPWARRATKASKSKRRKVKSTPSKPPRRRPTSIGRCASRG